MIKNNNVLKQHKQLNCTFKHLLKHRCNPPSNCTCIYQVPAGTYSLIFCSVEAFILIDDLPASFNLI